MDETCLALIALEIEETNHYGGSAILIKGCGDNLGNSFVITLKMTCLQYSIGN